MFYNFYQKNGIIGDIFKLCSEWNILWRSMNIETKDFYKWITNISMLLKSRASPDIKNFLSASVTRKDHPFPTTLSIPSYDIGK
jgi:hypothetical protein